MDEKFTPFVTHYALYVHKNFIKIRITKLNKVK